ncbi:MAG TPA: hypothetical protein GX716_07555 [Firmicutes bacterium]|jgi:hypothetical protein|nr:hypothetical protein [Candidatus Fermentithermobacillaceae bacterium]
MTSGEGDSGELIGLAASRYTWEEPGDLIAGEADIPSMENAKTGDELGSRVNTVGSTK